MTPEELPLLQTLFFAPCQAGNQFLKYSTIQAEKLYVLVLCAFRCFNDKLVRSCEIPCQ